MESYLKKPPSGGFFFLQNIFPQPPPSDKLCAGVVLYWGQKEMKGFKFGFVGAAEPLRFQTFPYGEGGPPKVVDEVKTVGKQYIFG